MAILLEGLKGKFLLLLVIVFVTFTAMTSITILDLKDTMLRERKMKLKNVVETAYGILEHYYKLVSEGKLSEEEAKQQARLLIKSIRYEGREYFWINDDTLPIPRMVMHPTVPSLDGKVLDDEKFNRAKLMQYGVDGEIVETDGKKNLFQAFNEVVNKAGSGYVLYEWPKPLPGGGVTKELYPKLSFVKKFEPWHWVIGSGVYIDDVNAAFFREAFRSIILAIVSLGVAGVIFWFIASKTIIKPIKMLTEQAEKIARGHLTSLITYTSKDEIGSLTQSINNMTLKLKHMIGEISTLSRNIVTSAETLRANAEKVSKGVSHQTQQASMIATSTEQMSRTITDIAKNSATAAETSEFAMKTAYDGKTIADGAINVVNSVYNSSVALAQTIEKLNSRVAEIGDIVTAIKDIADQTNLLALNAAIEAARAGEQGRGFAVVADEVKNLAERIIKETVEISEKIRTIQQESQQTVGKMTFVSNEVIKANDYIKKVGDSLNDIVSAVQKVKDQIMQIASAIDEQSTTSEKIAKNTEESSKVSKDMEGRASEVMSEAIKLNEVAKKLEQDISGFVI